MVLLEPERGWERAWGALMSQLKDAGWCPWTWCSSGVMSFALIVDIFAVARGDLELEESGWGCTLGCRECPGLGGGAAPLPGQVGESLK